VNVEAKQRVALITGASRGIGAETALAAAKLGYAVSVNFATDQDAANQVVAQLKSIGANAVAIGGDVSKASEVAAIFDATESRLGPVTALVNNAGITGPIGRFESVSTENLERVLAINVLGTFLCSREALQRHSKVGGLEVIVNVSSVASTTGSPGEYVHYAASKGAIDVFTVGLGKEVAPLGIRVCGVAPGSTFTEIHAKAGEPGRPERIAPRIPMGRLAQPEEIAQAIAWLLTPSASYVTATVLKATGGL
jgi:NAD(P)-dependent dehydrogenase (short-subunit alcohol dehydrogenase family)